MYQSGEADKKGNSTFELEICLEQCPRLHRFESGGTTSLVMGKVQRHRMGGVGEGGEEIWVTKRENIDCLLFI